MLQDRRAYLQKLLGFISNGYEAELFTAEETGGSDTLTIPIKKLSNGEYLAVQMGFTDFPCEETEDLLEFFSFIELDGSVINLELKRAIEFANKECFFTAFYQNNEAICCRYVTFISQSEEAESHYNRILTSVQIVISELDTMLPIFEGVLDGASLDDVIKRQ